MNFIILLFGACAHPLPLALIDGSVPTERVEAKPVVPPSHRGLQGFKGKILALNPNLPLQHHRRRKKHQKRSPASKRGLEVSEGSSQRMDLRRLALAANLLS